MEARFASKEGEWDVKKQRKQSLVWRFTLFRERDRFGSSWKES